MLKTIGKILFMLAVIPVIIAIFIGLWFLFEILLPTIGFLLIVIVVAVGIAMTIYEAFF